MEEGEYRLLLVDGHNSHYTVAFLLYAREHLIVVLCYIPHSTHIFQGLDVIIFSPLNKMIGEEWGKWLRKNGVAMDKNNFLEAYGKAHVCALSPANIKAAFKKTGIWPFNPDVVTEDVTLFLSWTIFVIDAWTIFPISYLVIFYLLTFLIYES